MQILEQGAVVDRKAGGTARSVARSPRWNHDDDPEKVYMVSFYRPIYSRFTALTFWCPLA